MSPEPLRPVVWVGDSLRVLRSFPAGVQDEVGYALFLAQRGGKPIAAKPLKGLAQVSWRWWRTASTSSMRCQKKSKHGIATPQSEIDLIKRRLKQAIAISEGQEQDNGEEGIRRG